MAQYLAVLEKLGVSIDAVYAIHLNAAYVRGKELDVRQLLIVDEYYTTVRTRRTKRFGNCWISRKSIWMPCWKSCMPVRLWTISPSSEVMCVHAAASVCIMTTASRKCGG